MRKLTLYVTLMILGGCIIGIPLGNATYNTIEQEICK